MEMALREAKAHLSERVAAACNGERVIITRPGHPAVELVRCEGRGGIDCERLDGVRQHLGLKQYGDRWPTEFDDPADSRQVLGLNDE